MDYFETDDAVDAKRVGIDGHSRYGKAALVAMAYDTRFRAAYVSSSGAGGAALWRRNFGEQGDKWADAKGEFLAEAAATPVYHVFGERGIEIPVFPSVGEAAIGGALGFRQHEFGHTQAPNWPTYLDFAEKAFR
jgi:hypothetical protein